jgi:hypothetical protein
LLVSKINDTFSNNFKEMAVAGEVLLGMWHWWPPLYRHSRDWLIPDLKTCAACALRGMDMNASKWGFQHFSQIWHPHQSQI